MTNQEILEKAIQKAQKNGWNKEYDISHTDSMGWAMTAKGKVKKSEIGLTAKITYMISENDIIYNHDFAKALWGKDTLSPNYGDLEMLSEPDYAWEHHLQQMVIADDPIKYLGDNL